MPGSEVRADFWLNEFITPLDIYQIYWRRAADVSLKSTKERFLNDFVMLAHQSKIALTQDQDGNYIVMLHPDGPKVEDLEKEIEASGQAAGMDVVFAPGLFG